MSLLHYCCKAGAPGIGWYWQRDVAWTLCLNVYIEADILLAVVLLFWPPSTPASLHTAYFKHYSDSTSISRTNKLSVTNTLIPVCLLCCLLFRWRRDSSRLRSPSPHPGSWSQPSLPLDKHEGPALCGLLWCAAAHSGGVTGLSAWRWEDSCSLAVGGDCPAVCRGEPCLLRCPAAVGI